MHAFEPDTAPAVQPPFPFRKSVDRRQLPSLRLTRCRGLNSFYADSCPSTMDLAWDLAQQGEFPEMSWVMTRHQTRGRGQLGRSWTPCSGNLYATIRLPDATRNHGTWLPLALAWALYQVLTSEGLTPQIKWPNDLLLHGKKVGGILVEIQNHRVMAGFGINVKGCPGPGDSTIQPACLADAGFKPDASALWFSLTDRLAAGLVDSLEHPRDLVRHLDPVLAFRHEWVVWEQASGRTDLVELLGLAPCGGLLIRSGREIRTVRSGRISPRIMI